MFVGPLDGLGYVEGGCWMDDMAGLWSFVFAPSQGLRGGGVMVDPGERCCCREEVSRVSTVLGEFAMRGKIEVCRGVVSRGMMFMTTSHQF
jgi:hypothetical protein